MIEKVILQNLLWENREESDYEVILFQKKKKV